MEGLNYLPYKKKIVELLSGNAFEGLELDGEICGISMMRAGESMEKALRDCSKAAVLGKMLIQKEDNGQFRIFYAKLPLDIHERFCFVLEPVLKTSQNVNLAIKFLLDRKVPLDHIIILSVTAFQEACLALTASHPNLIIVACELEGNSEARDAATSENILNGIENIELNLEVADFIKGKQVSSKEALKYMRKRLAHKNPNIQLLSLSLLDCCAKNCGQHFLVELASRDFVNYFCGLIRSESQAQVKGKMLECLQIWALSFRSKPELGYMSDAYETVRMEGFTFPPPPKIDSRFMETKCAPDWADSDFCLRCKNSFSLTNRKHHCRNCGNTFCQSCSSQTLPLPEFGINQPVRVCDGCYSSKRKGLPAARLSQSRSEFPSFPGYSSSPSFPGYSSSPHPAADEELELAIQMSLQQQRSASPSAIMKEDDPLLAVAIAASLEEEKKKDTERQERLNRERIEAERRQRYIEDRKKTQEEEEKMRKEQEKVRIAEIEAKRTENVRLFLQLMQKMEATGESVHGNLHIKALYDDLCLFCNDLKGRLYMHSSKKAQSEELASKISEGIKKYDFLLEARLLELRKRSQASSFYPQNSSYGRPQGVPMFQAPQIVYSNSPVPPLSQQHGSSPPQQNSLPPSYEQPTRQSDQPQGDQPLIEF